MKWIKENWFKIVVIVLLVVILSLLIESRDILLQIRLGIATHISPLPALPEFP